MLSVKKWMLFTLLLSCALFSYADADKNDSSTAQQSLWSAWKQNLQMTWQQPQQQGFYIPLLTWHNRYTYSDDKLAKYNEHPWGAGYGISRYDPQGDWHGFYIMSFKDSFNKWEPIAGYGYEKVWRPLSDEKFGLGAGYTLAVTARDNYAYIPLPLILPLFSVSYQPITLQATYIPGTYNNGNVLFSWLRVQF